VIGAIAGDVIGSVYEGSGLTSRSFPLWSAGSRFTDDTVLTLAVAEHLVTGEDLVDLFHRAVAAYPNAGYGGTFIRWAAERRRQPYGSWGNGSAMRVSPVGFAATSLPEALRMAEATAGVTHDHHEWIRGAQAVAVAVFVARHTRDASAVRDAVVHEVGYDLGFTLDEIRPTYGFDVSCQGSVPASIVAFLEAPDFEGAVRNAVSLGGDADTMACIAGAIAHAAYGVPVEIERRALASLDPPLLAVVEAFDAQHPVCNRRTA
jgi:ADP-ribosylglycohydrolase